VKAHDVRARHPELVRAQLAPEPPVSAGVVAALAGATAMLDVSDGLARDARRIAEASGVGIDFDGAALGPDLRVALAGAEDHGLLATFPAGAPVPAPFEVVGRVVDAPGEILVDGERAGADGWDPYSGWDGRSG
jgi:thiamine-monophosphate kinase